MFDTDFYIYPIMILASLFANVIVVFLIYDKTEFDRDQIICALVYENLGIFFGAKLLTLMTNFDKYKNIDLINIGFSSYGGLIGGLLLLIIFIWQFKKSFKKTMKSFLPSFPLMYAIGKIGCFLAGCCHGIKYSGPLSVTYNYSLVAPPNISFFPVQILETFCFLGIFIYIIFKMRQNDLDHNTIGISVFICGLFKFTLDFLRMSHIGKILSINQILSIVFIIIGLILIVKSKKHKKKKLPNK